MGIGSVKKKCVNSVQAACQDIDGGENVVFLKGL